MRSFHLVGNGHLASLFTAALFLASQSTAADSHSAPLTSLVRRDAQSISAVSLTDPVGAAQQVQQFPFLANNASAVVDWASQLVQGDSDEAQLSWNQFAPFVQTPNTTISATGGWQAVPALPGFDLNRTWEIKPGAIMPFYIKSGLDPAAVKRAIVTYPGKPRDAWKYANLYRNALAVVEANSSSGVANNTVLIVAPIWLNNLDQEAGSVQSKEIFFNGSAWQYGGKAIGPTSANISLSAYAVMDNFTDMLFDRATYPNLNQVVVAGHSMGGQASHRYAILKKQKRYDDNMSFWVGNPGSWTFLSSDRPYSNDSCKDTFDTWRYGIGQNTTKIVDYARKDVVANKDAVVKRYLARKVHMSLGLLDVGAGDTHCQARYQGGSHLDRGSQMVLHLAKVNNGTFPAAQTVQFVANTSHQDYAMISANSSLQWLFLNDYNVSYPDIVPSNPGDRDHTKTSRKDKSFATHGNLLLASTMLGGSLILVFAFFTILPFLFTANWVEDSTPFYPAYRQEKDSPLSHHQEYQQQHHQQHLQNSYSFYSPNPRAAFHSPPCSSPMNLTISSPQLRHSTSLLTLPLSHQETKPVL
ncbi:hypothetical protein CBS101457_003209 [Exobasidium rhododendri]|nr:hypothetical protein CBS101457_003209 [Exobasidium rhododendri]